MTRGGCRGWDLDQRRVSRSGRSGPCRSRPRGGSRGGALTRGGCWSGRGSGARRVSDRGGGPGWNGGDDGVRSRVETRVIRLILWRRVPTPSAGGEGGRRGQRIRGLGVVRAETLRRARSAFPCTSRGEGSGLRLRAPPWHPPRRAPRRPSLREAGALSRENRGALPGPSHSLTAPEPRLRSPAAPGACGGRCPGRREVPRHKAKYSGARHSNPVVLRRRTRTQPRGAATTEESLGVSGSGPR